MKFDNTPENNSAKFNLSTFSFVRPIGSTDAYGFYQQSSGWVKGIRVELKALEDYVKIFISWKPQLDQIKSDLGARYASYDWVISQMPGMSKLDAAGVDGLCLITIPVLQYNIVTPGDPVQYDWVNPFRKDEANYTHKDAAKAIFDALSLDTPPPAVVSTALSAYDFGTREP